MVQKLIHHHPMLLAAADAKVRETPMTAPASSDSPCSSAFSCQLTDAMLSEMLTHIRGDT